MREIRFLCLAVSKREGGVCIAGIDIDSGKWIRPVSTTTHGALDYGQINVFDPAAQTNPAIVQLRMRGASLKGQNFAADSEYMNRLQHERTLKKLDIVRLRLGEPVGTKAQPENWELLPPKESKGSYDLLSCFDGRKHSEMLWKLIQPSESFSLIFGTENNKVHHEAIEKETLSHSLLLIHPKNLSWVRTTDFNNNPRIEGHFGFGKRNIRYFLPVTDVDWKYSLLQATERTTQLDSDESPGMNAESEIVLTISLGENFDKTNSHYKLIAGVLLLPKR